MIGQTSIAQLLQQIPPAKLSQLSNQPIWVIGGGSGYGKAACLLLAGAGAKVFISGRNPEKLHQTRHMAEMMGFNPDNIYPIPVDITDPGKITTALSQIKSLTPDLAGLVLTAAIPQNQPTQTPLLNYSLEQWNQMLSTNLTSAFMIIQQALPLLLSSDRARIICFTSRAAWADTLGFGPYNISKCALNSYVRSLAQELRYRYPDQDIQVNAIEPGEAFTEMNQGSTASPLEISRILLTLLTTDRHETSGKFFDRNLNILNFTETH